MTYSSQGNHTYKLEFPRIKRMVGRWNNVINIMLRRVDLTFLIGSALLNKQLPSSPH